MALAGGAEAGQPGPPRGRQGCREPEVPAVGPPRRKVCRARLGVRVPAGGAGGGEEVGGYRCSCKRKKLMATGDLPSALGPFQNKHAPHLLPSPESEVPGPRGVGEGSFWPHT